MQIKDLSLELDTQTLSAVRGGNYGNSNVSTIGQMMTVDTPVMVGSGAGSSTNNTVNVYATQTGTICTDQYAGDIARLWAGIPCGIPRIAAL